MLTLVAVAALLICYVFCLVQALATNSLGWKVALYSLALAPSFAHGGNHGFGMQTLLAAVLFLGLTKFILYFGAREWGDRGDNDQ